MSGRSQLEDRDKKRSVLDCYDDSVSMSNGRPLGGNQTTIEDQA